MSNERKIETIKIVMIGDHSVGKTTYRKMITGVGFESKYVPTMGVEVDKVDLICQGRGQRFQIRLNIWDCAGQEKYSGLREGYYIGADAAIIMYSLTDEKSAQNLPKWVARLEKTTENIPVVFCANKCDGDSPKIIPSEDYQQISCKTGGHLFEPLLIIVRKIKNDPSIVLVE